MHFDEDDQQGVAEEEEGALEEEGPMQRRMHASYGLPRTVDGALVERVPTACGCSF